MYKLVFTREGQNTLSSVDKKTGQRILNKLKWLIQKCDSINHLSLKGGFLGLFKLRIGDWRVIYEIDKREKIISVHKIGHRRDIYK